MKRKLTVKKGNHKNRKTKLNGHKPLPQEIVSRLVEDSMDDHGDLDDYSGFEDCDGDLDFYARNVDSNIGNK